MLNVIILSGCILSVGFSVGVDAWDEWQKRKEAKR